jgi:hypothetical protein
LATHPARAAGIGVALAGAVVLGYEFWPNIARSLSGLSVVSVAFSPSQPQRAQPWAATVSVRGTPGAQLGAQAALIQPNGYVGGHLWASAQDAQQAYNTYWNTYDGDIAAGQSAGAASSDAENKVAELSGNFAYRVGEATADGSGVATIPLYAEQTDAGTYTLLVAVAVNPAGLIMQDPVGALYSALKRGSFQQAAFQVAVV